jgi:hypothetical protein
MRKVCLQMCFGSPFNAGSDAGWNKQPDTPEMLYLKEKTFNSDAV